MFLLRLRLVVFLCHLAGIRTSALGEAMSSALWAAAADKALVVEWPGEDRISPTPLAGVQPKTEFDPFNTTAFMSIVHYYSMWSK